MAKEINLNEKVLYINGTDYYLPISGVDKKEVEKFLNKQFNDFLSSFIRGQRKGVLIDIELKKKFGDKLSFDMKKLAVFITFFFKMGLPYLMTFREDKLTYKPITLFQVGRRYQAIVNLPPKDLTLEIPNDTNEEGVKMFDETMYVLSECYWRYLANQM